MLQAKVSTILKMGRNLESIKGLMEHDILGLVY